jgi:hypothetical protein
MDEKHPCLQIQANRSARRLRNTDGILADSLP